MTQSNLPTDSADTSKPASKQPAENRGNPLLELLINIIIPTLILSFLSKEQYLGNKLALILALSFPIIYGFKELIGQHKINFLSVIGVVTVALTGGMGLLELDPKCIAIKEAAIPAGLGLFTIISLKTSFPLVRTFIFNDKFVQVNKINAALDQNNSKQAFEKSLPSLFDQSIFPAHLYQSDLQPNQSTRQYFQTIWRCRGNARNRKPKLMLSD